MTNHWRNRVVVACVFIVASQVYEHVTASIPNTDLGMLLYHGSAATVEWVLFLSLPWLLTGKLLYDMQDLSIVCMGINALGWALYMAEQPPLMNDSLIGVLAYVQLWRLLMGDHHARDFIRPHMVRRAAAGRA